jgi:glycerol uptake facilitator-like aquaporin
MMNQQKWAAEFVGTAWLVLGGCGSAVLAAAFRRWASACSACPSPSAFPC